MGWKSASSRLAGLGGARGALVVAAVGLAFLAADTLPQRWLRGQLFDGYQQVLPRPRISQPVVVVEIDERSLKTYGQWPWPRSRLAELIDGIATAAPAAIGIDLLFAEPDRLSPRRIVEGIRDIEPALAARIAALPDNDAVFAEALRGRPVVLGLAGHQGAAPAPEDRPVRAAPVLLRGEPAGILQVPQFAGVVRARPELEAAAAGQGLINSAAEGVVRRVSLLGRVGDMLLTNLEIEMLRVATGEPLVEGRIDAGGVRAVKIGDVVIPTDPDGAVWLRYAERDPAHLVSAADVLQGTADPARFERKFVLLGLTGLGLVDQPPTPLGERVPGVEIRAQLLENIFDRSWLTRPPWAPWVEAGLFLLLAAGCLLLVPHGSPRESVFTFASVLVALALGGLVAFKFGLLLDVATPGMAAAMVFTLALAGTLAESQRQRRELAERLQAEREAAARVAGELETARRVQMGMLPESPGLLAGDPRIDLHAFMEPARSVGGDLYDFFLLDERTLCVMIGDVSGKGIAAAMFMALIKSLCKSAVLRQPRSLALALAQAESEIKRENPESLFVTLLVLTLDLDSGEFSYCNAGHDPLYGLLPDHPEPRKLDHGGRPPLCVLDGYPYPVGRDRLVPGEMLCMITDGITEAADRTGHLYGHKRLEDVLTRMHQASPEQLIEAVRRDVVNFAAGAEQADDMSVVALRWAGPRVRAVSG
jgi:serine phosphatase RsbU (regulator of sigma subunit)